MRERCAALPPPGRVWMLRQVAEPKTAALLIPVVERDGEAAVVLTKRPSTMRHHRNDWVFPGGRFDPAVDSDTAATALREAAEELGLAPERTELVGRLSTFGPISTGFLLDVYVALADAADLAPDPREVAEIAVVPISALAAEAAFRQSRELPPVETGPRAEVTALYVEPGSTLLSFFTVRPGEEIWGAQGAVMSEFLTRMLAP